MIQRTSYTYLLISTFLIQLTLPQDTSKEYNYSTIAEAFGYAEITVDRETRDILRLAYTDAKRNLLEKSMIYIKSYSKVENYVLEYDLIESESKGFLRIIEQKDLGFTNDNRYRVWIKAEVIYHFKNENNSQNPDKSVKEPLAVKIWTEKEIYILKEKVKVFLLPNKNCYIRVIYKDANNTVLQIFPNQHKKDNYFKANKLYTIPDDSDSYEFTVSSPFGEEKITVFASTSQFGHSQMDNYGPDFYKFDGNEQEYSFKTRGVKITNKEVPVEFFQESCKIVVENK